MKKLLLGIVLIGSFVCSCKKNPGKEANSSLSIKGKISKKWKFSSQPQPHLNNFQGHTEDRTVFSGLEELEFNTNDTFYISGQSYGTWSLSSPHIIDIDMTSTNGYAAYGFSQNRMVFDILFINNSVMHVNHPYYKYNDNKYMLKATQ